MEINECDFCGDEFDYPPNPELEDHDVCVCRECEDLAAEQLEGDELQDSEEDDFEDLEGSAFFNEW